MKSAIDQTSRSERIIEGQTAPEPIPWQAHMRYGNPNSGFGWFCGGTIIDARTILTAAHCYYKKMNWNLDGFFIAAGAVNIW